MFAEIGRSNLLKLADAYAKATGMSLSAVSRKFYGNVTFLPEFKKGVQSISLRKFDEVVDKFRAEWPRDAAWPFLRSASIRRPGW